MTNINQERALVIFTYSCITRCILSSYLLYQTAYIADSILHQTRHIQSHNVLILGKFDVFLSSHQTLIELDTHFYINADICEYRKACKSSFYSHLKAKPCTYSFIYIARSLPSVGAL